MFPTWAYVLLNRGKRIRTESRRCILRRRVEGQHLRSTCSSIMMRGGIHLAMKRRVRKVAGVIGFPGPGN
jgi:hypothetical protein